MSHEFNNADDIVRWFLTDKHGEPKKIPSHDEADLRTLVTNMLAKPDPFDSDGEPPRPSRVWNWIVDFGLLHLGQKNGWIDREGKMWGCGWAQHDRLLYWMGREAGDVEADGWVKVSNGRYRSRYRMTPAQRKTMRAIGVAVDNETERMLPHWRAGDTSPAETANLGADRDDYKRGP